MSIVDDLSRATAAGRSTRLVERVARLLGGRTDVTRRGFLVQTAVVGSALAVDPKGFVLRPQSALSTVCGPDNTAAGGYTVFCCTVNRGVNACPPGTFTAGWWKAADSSWCCGGYRYIVDCNATCTTCSSGCGSDHICDRHCWNCSCGHGSTKTCDQRRVCCNAFRYGQCNTHVSCSGGVACRLVSCVPPYHWDSCSTTSFSDNHTAEHNAPCLQGCSAILTEYDRLGANGSFLGASTSTDRSVGDGRGTYVTYRRGAIYHTSATGAHSVYGASRELWDSLGGPRSALGYPTAERVTHSDDSWSQTFEHGLICDSRATHTTAVSGAIWTAYAAHGRESGALGYPTGAAHTGRDKRGTGQSFQHGQIWRLGSGHAYVLTGAVLRDWLADGAETGRWGYPLSDVTTNSHGHQQATFEHGVLVA